ncbi:MAG: hypothetical protein L0Z50_07990, partial [Verrucomicrobiales bacterium]|nr:hypothetical protein [Verrucomicrobiales bacterium]
MSQFVTLGDACGWRHSATHDPEAHPGHLLYGTWSGALASVLLGLDRTWDERTRDGIARTLNSFQEPDGTYVMRGIPSPSLNGHDAEYFSFHCTNYALGALRAIGRAPRFRLGFLDSLSSAVQLSEWLARRDWSHPWAEGNNIVNLASFYAILAEDGAKWAAERLQEMADWHDAHQNPVTGLWHEGAAQRPTELLNAIAGAAHNFHIYYHLNRNVPQASLVVDSCLRSGYLGIRSAC